MFTVASSSSSQSTLDYFTAFAEVKARETHQTLEFFLTVILLGINFPMTIGSDYNEVCGSLGSDSCPVSANQTVVWHILLPALDCSNLPSADFQYRSMLSYVVSSAIINFSFSFLYPFKSPQVKPQTACWFALSSIMQPTTI